MPIKRRTFAAIHGASRDETRYNLNSVHVESDGWLVGTSGHHLVAIHEPALDGLEPVAGLYTRESVENARAMFGGKSREGTIARREDGVVEVEGPKGTAKLEPVDGEHPDWRSLLRSTRNTSGETTARSVVFDVELLRKVLDARVELGTSYGVHSVRLTIRDDCSALELEGWGEDGTRMLALLMPLRDDSAPKDSIDPGPEPKK